MTLPALVDAAAVHADGFVRYRALVLLSGYDDPRVPDQMEQALGDVNDRLRAVAFAYFERHPDPRLIPVILKALDHETAEFVRPALIRALAAHGRDTRVRAALLAQVAQGRVDFRRAAVEALGDHRVGYSLKTITAVAQTDGPVRAEALLSLGQLGDPASATLLATAQQTAGRRTRPAVAASLCLLGSDCETHREFLLGVLTVPDRTAGGQDLPRVAARGLAALAASGDTQAGRALLRGGLTANEATRAPVAVALARLAVRRPLNVVALLAEAQDLPPALALLRSGFDRLGDEFLAEQFFVELRQAYHQEPEGSPTRAVIQAAINALEF